MNRIFTHSKMLVTGSTVFLILAYSGCVMGAGSGSGFAWADKPTQAGDYQPSSAYSYNSSGGRVSIKRNGNGNYRVTFSGLGGNGRAGGHVQVSAYGGGSEYCNAVNWDSGGADFVINVRCFDAAGALKDARYSIYALWPNLSSSAGPATPTLEISRTILPDGKVRIERSDGSIKTIGPGGYTITMPDGQSLTYAYSTQAPAAVPPTPPGGSPELLWLEQLSNGLLSTISILVDNNQQSIDNYLAAEGSAGVYDKIAKRQTTLSFMVSQ